MSKTNEFSWMAAQVANSRERQTVRNSSGFTVIELIAILQKMLCEKPELAEARIELADEMCIIGPAREVEAETDGEGEGRVIISN
jgi:hypothetical protein